MVQIFSGEIQNWLKLGLEHGITPKSLLPVAGAQIQIADARLEQLQQCHESRE